MGETLESAKPDAPANPARTASEHTLSARAWTGLVGALEQNVFVVLILGLGVAALGWRIRGSLDADAWYTLVAGRTITMSGLPRHDSLTVLTAGREWVDQQWLAHLALYDLWRVGGWPIALLGVVACYAGTFALMAATARRLGASDRGAALVAVVCFTAGFQNTAFRAQTAAYLLFGLVAGLLLLDERCPSRRVLLVFPLLVVWANIHGSVVLGAGLVALRGATLAASELHSRRPARGWLPRAGAFLVLPWICTLASPYGLALPGYYRRVLDNPTLDRVASEWAATTVRNQPFFFVLLFAALVLSIRSRKALTPFAQLALLGTALAGLFAIRNVIWFTFVAAATLPPALDELWTPRDAPRRRRTNLALAAGGIVIAVVSMTAGETHDRAWFQTGYPGAAARAVSDAAASNPKVRVFANDRYADWLLFEDPQLAGRVAYDIRFELLTRAQLSSVAAFLDEDGASWERAASGYRLLVLDSAGDRGAIQTFERARGTTVLYRDANVVVLLRAAIAIRPRPLAVRR